MKKSLFLTLTLFSIIVLAQVGIGNSNPRGLLDVNDNPSGDAAGGLVLPTTDQTSSILNPQDGSISNVTATTIYDSSLDCIRVIKNDGTYSNCLDDDDNNNNGGGNSSFYCDGLNNLKTYSTVFSTLSTFSSGTVPLNGTAPLNSIITFMDNNQDIYYSGKYGASQAQLSTDWVDKNTSRENIITRVNVLSEVLSPLNKQWKQFIAITNPQAYYTTNTQINGVFLLSEDGDLYFTIHPYIDSYDYKIADFNGRADLLWQLPAVAGRDAENYTISTSDNTPLSWVWKINDGLTNSLGNPLKFDEIIFQDANVVVAYCAEDNQVYTWGGRGMYSTGKANAYDKELLREANTLTDCLTPTLAVDINLITNRNNTRVSLKGDKIMDVSNITYYRHTNGTIFKYNAAFITEDGYFNSWDIRNISNGNYRVHVNGGVKLKGFSLSYNNFYGLGDNGKIYNIPSLVNGWGSTNGNGIANGAVYPTSQDQEVIISETEFFNTHVSSSSLNIIDMSNDEIAQDKPYLIALTSDGSIYIVPKGSDAVTNLTTLYDLPFASKLLGIRNHDIYIVGSDNKTYVINDPENVYSNLSSRQYLISKDPYDILIDKNDNIINGNYSKVYKCVAFPY